MVSATDGSAFTGSVTVHVTGDGGAQATGSVGSGACTHEGNGFHTYAPAQAETNYDHVAFTFTGTGAIPVTVQVYTTFPQTGDSYARLGAPAGASVSADVAAVKTQTAAIETDTQDIQSRLPAALVNSRMDCTIDGAGMEAGAVAVLQTGLATAAALATVDSNVDAILEDTSTTLPATLSTIAGYVDTEVAAIKAKTDQLTFTTAGQVDATTVTNSDKTGYSISGTKTTLDDLNDIAAADVWSVTTRVLTADTNISGMSVNLTKVNGVTITGDGSTTPFDVA